MLRNLKIENIAVVESADIEFSDGLNVLTGETGAGKSILIDSINAVLGERTSKDLIRNDCESGFVSAYFDNANDKVNRVLKEFDIPSESDNSLLITRRISLNGKSYCKVNGVNVTVSMLKKIGNELVNIHGQNDNQYLLNSDLHYEFIDMISDNKSILSDYKKSFTELIKVRRKLKSLEQNEYEKAKKLELLKYQIDELENADIKVGEKQELQKQKAVFVNSEALLNTLNASAQCINGSDDFSGVSLLCREMLDSFSKFSSISPEFEEISHKCENVCELIEEIKSLIQNRLKEIEFNPSELEIIEDRLDLLYKLSEKYGATEENMLSYLDNAKNSYNEIISAEEEISLLTAEYDERLVDAVNLANKLTEERKKTALKFEKAVKEQLAYLDMPNIQFSVDFRRGKLNSTGLDKIEFLISTNPGEPPKPLSKIASGGELSRIMLAIKSILAHNDTIATLIFDEIDTGVSGRASRKIGYRLKSVSESCQVICVTHSAQIASVADTHLLISKDIANNKTYTKVTPLDFEGRKKELARIMGGLQITQALLNSAQELLENTEDN